MSLSSRLAGVTEKQLAESSTLFLKSRQLNDEDCAAIAPHLAKNRSLREIYIGFNAFGDEGARHLCEALAQAASDVGQQLSLLGLRRCRLGDGAAEAVAELLRKSPSLVEVGVDENEIGDAGAAALAAALPEAPALRQLYVAQNAITAEGRAKLDAAAGKASVFWSR
mmetsp:Transcript_96949/g.269838  ORF Transcript_96949/g.269838 Transcript_96949/m.269838 type:complete len:167 (-) Transcript_96949:394-894(-)